MFGGNQEKETKFTTIRQDQVNGLLDKGCSFEGKLTFDGTVQINGDFQGEIFSDGTLVIGNDAKVNAKIFVDTLVTYGRVEGEVEAKNMIEMHVPATVIANIKTKNLSVENGVVFEGRCQMDSATRERTAALPENAYAEAKEGEEEEDVLVM